MLVPAIAKMASMSHAARGGPVQGDLDDDPAGCCSAYGQDMTITQPARRVQGPGPSKSSAFDDDPRIKDLAIMLKPYTRDGQYARFFEGPSNIDFSNDFIVIENEELKRGPTCMRW